MVLAQANTGGVMLYDDYGFRSYRYAIRAAVDEFFAQMEEKPIVLPTAQAVVIKSGGNPS